MSFSDSDSRDVFNDLMDGKYNGTLTRTEEEALEKIRRILEELQDEID